jgi:hypothetical protein
MAGRGLEAIRGSKNFNASASSAISPTFLIYRTFSMTTNKNMNEILGKSEIKW